MKYYVACQLFNDGTYSAVDFGGGPSEKTAALIALHQANLQQHHMCVVEVNGTTERIVQKIEYRNEIALVVSAEPSEHPTRYFGPAYILDAVPFIVECVANGYQLTITPAVSATTPNMVNIVAHYFPHGVIQ